MNQVYMYVLVLLWVILHSLISVLWHKPEESIFRNAKATSFFGSESWKRKYKIRTGALLKSDPDHWYYSFFNIKYKERFPGSATIFVFLTDAPHFFQFIMLTIIAVLLTVCQGGGLWNFIMIKISISIIHQVFYAKIWIKK